MEGKPPGNEASSASEAAPVVAADAPGAVATAATPTTPVTPQDCVRTADAEHASAADDGPLAASASEKATPLPSEITGVVEAQARGHSPSARADDSPRPELGCSSPRLDPSTHEPSQSLQSLAPDEATKSLAQPPQQQAPERDLQSQPQHPQSQRLQPQPLQQSHQQTRESQLEMQPPLQQLPQQPEPASESRQQQSEYGPQQQVEFQQERQVAVTPADVPQQRQQQHKDQRLFGQLSDTGQEEQRQPQARLQQQSQPTVRPPEQQPQPPQQSQFPQQPQQQQPQQSQQPQQPQQSARQPCKQMQSQDINMQKPSAQSPMQDPHPQQHPPSEHGQRAPQNLSSQQPQPQLQQQHQEQTVQPRPSQRPEQQQQPTGAAAVGNSDAEDKEAEPLAKPLPFRESLESSELVLLDLLGSGAQAEVYRAIWWRSFGCSTSAITVAVKRLHGNVGQRVHSCELLARQVKHPNLVKCFDATTKAPFLIVSEFCAGGSLYDRIHDQSNLPLAWRQRLKIMVDVAKGLEYLHSCRPRILHRDLKSCNVLLTKPIKSSVDVPFAKVSDFGLSRFLQETQSQAAMTKCVGTWRWMAPEVFSKTDYNEKIDVFSFGILMFEVLTGEIPYASTWPLNSQVNPRIGLHICNGHRPNLRHVQTGCPTKVVQLMQECWAGDPDARPDFTEVRDQLRAQLELVTLYGKLKNDNTF